MIYWIAIAGLALAALVLVARHDAGTVLGFANSEFARIIALVALAFVVGTGLLWRMRGNLTGLVRMAAIWIVIAALLVVGYSYRHDARMVVARVIGEIVPGLVVETAPGEVAVARSGNGHFVVDAVVNGAPVTMLFDTGASMVVLTPADAALAGIDIAGLAYSVPVWTANGRTTAAPVVLDSLAVGSITVSRVRAVVAQPGGLRESLLGMSFLDRIRGWSVERDRLTFRG